LNRVRQRTIFRIVSSRVSWWPAVCLLLIATTNSLAATINIPTEAATVQGGIDLAGDGDTVLIAAGIYHERINFDGKAITVGGPFLLSGDSIHIMSAVIDGDPNILGPADSGSVVRFVSGEGAGSVLCGLTLQKGMGTSNNGGGILCSQASPVIRDCLIRLNVVSGTGGGMYCKEGSEPLLLNCRFEENRCGFFGGGLAANFSSPILDNCIFEQNLAQAPFGMSAGIDFFYSNPILTNCRVSGNVAAMIIGGVSCYESPASFDHCVFEGNQATFAGGLYCYGDPPTVTNGTFVFNDAPFGSAIYSEGCSYDLSNSIVAFNQQGAGIVAMFDSIPSIACTDIYGNEGGDWVGDISAQASINGNLSTDPLFCDALSSDFSIDSLSPCAPNQNSCGTLIGAVDPKCSGTLRAFAYPDTLHTFDVNSVNPSTLLVVVGNFTSGYSVEEIDLASLRVNDSLVPDSCAVLTGHPDFAGQVVVMYMNTGSYLNQYGWMWDITLQPCVVTGLFNDKSDIDLTAMVTLMGHVSGDVNNDGSRDISDLVLVVDYFFNNGPSLELPDAVDLDRNGTIDITDLTLLVERMFSTVQPEPLWERLLMYRD